MLLTTSKHLPSAFHVYARACMFLMKLQSPQVRAVHAGITNAMRMSIMCPRCWHTRVWRSTLTAWATQPVLTGESPAYHALLLLAGLANHLMLLGHVKSTTQIVQLGVRPAPQRRSI